MSKSAARHPTTGVITWSQRLLLSTLLLLMAGCAWEPPPAPKTLPTFGDQLPGTIHVLILNGCKRPGHYHLPTGATLGLLIDVAGFEPVTEPFWVTAYVAHLLVIQNDRSARHRKHNVSTDDGISKANRVLRLQDGDRIQTGCIVW